MDCPENSLYSRESTILSQGTMEDVMSGVGPNDIENFLKTEDIVGSIGDCLQQDAHFWVGPEQHTTYDIFGDLPDSTQQKIMTYVSTSVLPSMEDYPGPFDFDVEMNKASGDRAKWEYSSDLNKLFVIMDYKIPLKFKANTTESGLLVRVLPVFLAQDSFAEPVRRCPTHLSTREKSNEGFDHVDHVVRCHHEGALYLKNLESERLSVIVPTEPPQPGCNGFTAVFSFMCKNSCGLGMNRRHTALIFTLERQTGEVIGRKILNIRICSCPRRDMQKEECYNMKKEGEEKIVEKKSSEKKILKKPLKHLTKGLVNIPVPKNYLKAIGEMISVHKDSYGLSEEEKISIEAISHALKSNVITSG